jgi:hypothetical protein
MYTACHGYRHGSRSVGACVPTLTYIKFALRASKCPRGPQIPACQSVETPGPGAIGGEGTLGVSLTHPPWGGVAELKLGRPGGGREGPPLGEGLLN